MRIAQIAPLAGSVPPTGRVVSYLIEELVRLGHDVALFAGDDSLERARQQAHKFDLLHFHAGCAHFPLFQDVAHKTVTTLHDRLDLPGMAPALREFPEMPLVSVSDAQRLPVPDASWAGTVYYGLPAEVCPLNPSAPRGAARYLAFLGRISPESGIERALEIALRTRTRLRIAAKIGDGDDSGYWREAIAPRVRDAPALLQYVGEVDEGSKPAFLGNAAALLFPIDRPEPFGLAMIEAMSCGTPVIAWRRGAAPEIVEHGLTGFIVDSIDEAVGAAGDLGRLDRTRVRERFDARFSAARMAQDYLSVYRGLGRTRSLRLARA